MILILVNNYSVHGASKPSLSVRLSNDGGRQAAVARGVNDLRIEDWISGQPRQFAIENHHF